MLDNHRARSLFVAFIVGMVLLNFPLTTVVDALADVIHPANAVLYLFLIWAVLIGLLMVLVEHRTRH